MSTAYSPNVVNDVAHITLGDGAIVKNFLTSEESMGACRGGSEFNVEIVIRDLELDNAYGPVSPYKRTDTHIAKLTVNYLEITTDCISAGLPVITSDGSDEDGTYHKMVLDLEIKAAYVLGDITYKGRRWKTGTTGSDNDLIIILENAVNIDSFEFSFEHKSEVVASIVYTGFYGYATPTIPPWQVWDKGM